MARRGTRRAVAGVKRAGRKAGRWAWKHRREIGTVVKAGVLLL